MMDSKVIIFGNFSEDETLSLQASNKTESQKVVTKPSVPASSAATPLNRSPGPALKAGRPIALSDRSPIPTSESPRVVKKPSVPASSAGRPTTPLDRSPGPTLNAGRPIPPSNRSPIPTSNGGRPVAPSDIPFGTPSDRSSVPTASRGTPAAGRPPSPIPTSNAVRPVPPSASLIPSSHAGRPIAPPSGSPVTTSNVGRPVASPDVLKPNGHATPPKHPSPEKYYVTPKKVVITPVNKAAHELNSPKRVAYESNSVYSPRKTFNEVPSPKKVANELKRVSLHPEHLESPAVVNQSETTLSVVDAWKVSSESKSWASLVGVQDDTAGGKRLLSGPPSTTKDAAPVIIKRFPPRGLVNTGNTCFLNSTLQALLSCSPFCELLKNLKAQAVSQEKFPLLHAFASFATELEEGPSESTTEKYYRKGQDEVKLTPAKDVDIGKPFAPVMFDPILSRFNPQQPAVKGGPRNRQEDAEEFLGYLMNEMHEELIKLDGRGNQMLSANDTGEWETVGPRNRTAFTRTYSLINSPLSDIFGGQQHSVVKVKGSKPSATVEPFNLLHLEICSESVNSVEDALRFYGSPEMLEGYKSASGKTEDASKSVKISSLPKILILHLKRFSYGAKGTGKIQKPIRYPPELTLGRELLTSTYEARKYELVATITHHGKDSSSGHYTADTKQSDGTWLRFDDRTVIRVERKDVFHDQAYILFYRRLP